MRRPFQVTVAGVAATVFVFAVAALCVRFGFWQLDRLEQRRARNAQVRARLEAPAAALTAVPKDSIGWLQRRVTVHGSFDVERSIVIPGRAYQGSPGAHVLTPIVLDNGDAVLADRGWVPAPDGATVDLAALPPVPDQIDTALVLPFPGQEGRRGRSSPSDSSVEAREFRRVWFSIDESALRAQFPYRLGAVHVRLLPSANAPALPVREPAPELSAGSHLGYAIQWFSFAMIAIVGWVALVLKSRR